MLEPSARKRDLVKKMADLDEFYLEYMQDGKKVLTQGTQNPGIYETNGRKPKDTAETVVFWDRLSQSYLNIQVRSVKSIRALQTVMMNSFRSI